MTSTFLFDSAARASRHPLVREGLSADFFEGAILGNGSMGAIVCTRPDSILIHFGHNNVWDIRVEELARDEIGTFEEVWSRVKAIAARAKERGLVSMDDDPWFREYCRRMEEPYRKPYPRPFPCGSLLLGFDPRRVEVLEHRVDISSGMCSVTLLCDSETRHLQIFADRERDRLWLLGTDEDGAPSGLPFDRVRLLSDPQAPPELPLYETHAEASAGLMAFRQVLPKSADGVPDASPESSDRSFVLSLRVSEPLAPATALPSATAIAHPAPDALQHALSGAKPFVACVQLDEGLARDVALLHANALPDVTPEAFAEAAHSTRRLWTEFWNRSGVVLGDEFLERTWYHNLYFFGCAVRRGVTCPGLFACWSYGDIGTAWHGDYHMNYNTQQPFWVAFSSNHVETHEPYVDLVHHLLPVSRKWAREYYGLHGACFPHSAYPTKMSIMPYPVPIWGWEICETPWTPQSLWWHYLYTQDTDFLRERAWTPMREAVLFLTAYMMREEARGGASTRFDDDLYHIFPTVAPELFGIAPDLSLNFDCLADLTLTRFLFKAYLEACRILQREAEEEILIGEVRELLAHFPALPTAQGESGTVFTPTPSADPRVVQNAPASLMSVFPGEEHGLHSPREEYEVAARTYHEHRNEGGNELVFLNLQAARLGLLDLEKWKRQIRYCLMPNGTCTDMILRGGGRYDDTTPRGWMARMGIWFENFALPAVLNECLLQSYNGALRLFPNWHGDGEFHTLRAAGAFLVSARKSGGEIERIEVLSEAGAPLRLHLPWKQARCERKLGEHASTESIEGPLWETQTQPQETLIFTRFE